SRVRRTGRSQGASLFPPPDYDRHILRDDPLAHVIPYVNWYMLIGRHRGHKCNVEQLLASGDERAMKLKETIDELVRQSVTTGSSVSPRRPAGCSRRRCTGSFRRSPTARTTFSSTIRWIIVAC